MKISTALSFLRLQPYDTTTEAGRTRERHRLAALAMASNLMGRLVMMLVMVISVSLTVPYLGQERFGIWMTIASFGGLLTFLDLGIGNAINNHVARCAASESPEKLSRAVTGGLGLIAAIALPVTILLLILASTIPWEHIVKLTTPGATRELRESAILFVIIFGINLIGSSIQKVFSGLQMGYVVNIATIIASLSTIAALWVATQANAGIPLLLAITFGFQSIAAYFLLPILFARNLIKPAKFREFFLSEYRPLLSLGTLFLVLQVGTMAVFGVDALIIAHKLGAEEVAVYSITLRLFQFVTSPVAIINTPLWSAYADASARKDFSYIQSTLKNSLMAVLAITIVGGTIIVAFGNQISIFWTSGKIVLPTAFLIAFAIWIIIESCGSSLAMLLNGCQIIKPQIVVVIFLTAVILPAKFWLPDYIGIQAFPLISAICYVGIPYLIYRTVFFDDICRAVGIFRRAL